MPSPPRPRAGLHRPRLSITGSTEPRRAPPQDAGARSWRCPAAAAAHGHDTPGLIAVVALPHPRHPRRPAADVAARSPPSPDFLLPVAVVYLTPAPVPGAAPPPLRLTASTRRASSPSSPRLAADTRGALRPTSPRGAPRRRSSSSPSPSSTSSSPSTDHPDPRCLSPYRPCELRSSSSFPCSRARKPTAAPTRARPGPPVPDCRSLRVALLAVPSRCPPWPRSGRVQSGLSRARVGPRRALSLQPTGRPRAAPATAVLGAPPHQLAGPPPTRCAASAPG
nr:nascent polypeptide-associated complex subunit alpha, muscle-specific form-like [Aegilops tauschii subsp. strangulata]